MLQLDTARTVLFLGSLCLEAVVHVNQMDLSHIQAGAEERWWLHAACSTPNIEEDLLRLPNDDDKVPIKN